MNQYYFFTKDYIYSKVSQETIFEYYFGEKISLSKRYKSPLRKDSSPGCSFYYGQSGDLLFYDSKEGSMDCIKFIMSKYNLSFFDTMVKIKTDLIELQTIKKSSDFETKNSLKKIEIKKRNFNQQELDYWQIPDEIIKEDDIVSEGIFSISDLWYNEEHKYSNLNMCFAYKQSEIYSYQIYRPLLDKSLRFRTNNGNFIYSFDKLDFSYDYVLINKSKKDNFYARFLGYNSIGIISENINISDKVLEFLKLKFKKIYLCLDNDETGIKYSNKLKSILPEIILKPSLHGKDFTDMCKIKGGDWVKNNFIC
jgi:hypothetical protein